MDLTTRQKEIVLNSISIISRQGIQDLTIKNIAAAINVTEAALYRHFKSKNELLMAVLNYFDDLSRELVDAAELEGKTPLQKMELFVMKRYALFMSNPDLAKVMFSEVLFENEPALSAKMLSIIQRHMHQFLDYVNQAQTQNYIRSDIEGQQIFRMIIGSMRLLVTQWTLNEFSFPLEEEGRKLWNSITKLIQ
ncbi:MAG TPA: TetR/AcrR family transcriptional regulator [Candidatus Cloacimonadota bacterium]|nr:TetR/AcrR family transcriptional regulator [Candidatus Cloacimonadota bacterium]HPT71304.1 TetR/AcrR family transcriptional regulator [Candidatus Cloacimonadota bacterium]